MRLNAPRIQGGLGVANGPLASPTLANPNLSGAPQVQGKPKPLALQIVQGLEGLSTRVAAGFAKDPNVRAQKAQQLQLDQQQQQEQRAAWTKELLDNLQQALPAYQQAYAANNGQLPQALQADLQDTLNLMTELNDGDPTPVQAIADTLWAQIQNPPAADQDPTTQKINALRAQGIELTPDELKQLGGARVTPDSNALTEKISATEAALGRKLTPQEIVQMSGAAAPPGINLDLKVLTGEQQAAAGFADRMGASEGILTGLENQGYQPSPVENTLSQLPGIGNYLISDQTQQYKQAAYDWITANLRKESGATITEEEFDRDYKKYFPQPGDGPDVVAQKRAARLRTQAAVEGQSIPVTAGEARAKSNKPETRPDQIFTPKTDEDFAKIPLGAHYVNPADGQIYIKTSE